MTLPNPTLAALPRPRNAVHSPVVEPGTDPVREKLPPLVTRGDVLERAAEIIEERGWTRGISGMPYHGGNTAPVCYLGSLEAAWMDLGFDARSGYQLGRELLGKDPDEAWAWNDSLPYGGFRNRRTRRSQARVAKRLRALAAKGTRK